MRRLFAAAAALMVLLAPSAFGAEKLHEADYVRAWCTTGQIEYVLPDRTRVDCLTDEYAIEFDFAHKWAEAIGQSLHYARMTGRKPGIVVITRDPSDRRHLEKLKPLTEGLGIRLWEI